MTTLPLLYNDLLDACRRPGCPVCRLVQQEVRRYLAGLFYDAVNDIPLREQLRRSRGFCREHAWLAVQPGVGDALGLAIIYHDVFANLLRQYPNSPEGSRANRGLAGLIRRAPRGLMEAARSLVATLRPQAPCPACVLEAQNTQLVIADLLTSIDLDYKDYRDYQDEQDQDRDYQDEQDQDRDYQDEQERDEQDRKDGREGRGGMWRALRDSDGLCLPHLSAALQAMQDGAVIEALLSAGRHHLAALDAELSEFIRKNDYRFRDEAMGGERDAWRRAVRLAVGEHPWMKD